MLGPHYYHIYIYIHTHICYIVRKKLRQDVTKQYPGLSDEAASSIIPNKEEMSVMKIYTHSGQSVIVYNLQKIPVFFEIDRILYPTGKNIF